jgi:outer membrane protein assembly factor BamB
MFRGNAAHSGVYAASPGQALAGLQWRFMTDGDVVSSPTVVGETVFVGSGDGHLYAVDRATGTRKWAFDAREPIFSVTGRGRRGRVLRHAGR